MSIHIGARHGAIAQRVLLPGDPLRAEYIANTFLRDVKPYNTLRNMLGFTGYTPEGRWVSVQGSGMGMPSLGIYVNELAGYGVREIIRVGSCGALQRYIGLRDIILAQGSCSESAMNRRRFRGMDFAPIADWDLLLRAYQTARNTLKVPVHVGNVLAADMFYNDVDGDIPPADQTEWKLWARYGVLAVEMETAELYTLAAKKDIQALSILTVSDSLPFEEQVSSEDRENTFADMVRIALTM